MKLSWLIDVTGEASAARLLDEIARLQQELDIANESIDDKLDKLEEAGLDVVGLSKALESARRRISNLEKEANVLHCSDETNNRYTDLRKSYERMLRQLDLQNEELEELRFIASSQADEIKRVNGLKKNADQGFRKQFLASSLSSELDCIQSEADQLGHDLQELLADRDGLVTHYRRKLEMLEQKEGQNQLQLAMANEHLDHYKMQDTYVTEKSAHYVFYSYFCHLHAFSQDVLLALSARHKAECKGLFVQIRYLKARCNRESEFRNDLAHQKYYLLVILSRFQKRCVSSEFCN